MIAVAICALIFAIGAFAPLPRALEIVSFLRLPDRRIRLTDAQRYAFVDQVGGTYRSAAQASAERLEEITPRPSRAGWIAVRAQTTLQDGHLVLSARYFPLAPFVMCGLCFAVCLPMNVEAKVVHLSSSFVAALYMFFSSRSAAERIMAGMEAELRRRVDRAAP
jgi:hypothetical protein